eukprot:8362310-Pyramimonas_sp.AAC.1
MVEVTRATTMTPATPIENVTPNQFFAPPRGPSPSSFACLPAREKKALVAYRTMRSGRGLHA